jgi:hypothetical protein
VVQYADDTIIVMQGEEQQFAHSKRHSLKN